VANGSRPPVTPVRKWVAAALAAVATFVMLFGVGRQSWSTVAIGAALLLLALGLLAVTAARGGASAWVLGTGHVVSVSEPPASSVFGRCEMQLVIDAPSLSPRSVKVRDPRVPVAKWPDPGATLPITIALDDPRRVRVLWDEVLTHAEVAEDVTGAEGFGAEEVFVSRRSSPGTDGEPPPDAEPATVDLTDALGDLRGRPDDIVVRETPGGPKVIEGVVVGQRATIPAPREATTQPRTADDAPAPDDPAPYEEFASVGVTLLVADLDRSVHFYERMLGLPVIDRGKSSAVLASGSTRLVVRAVRDVAPVDRRLVHINLEVADIAAGYARLRDRGVRFTYGPRVVNRGRKLEVWAAAFRDPDGHGIALTEWRDRAKKRATATS
jgi:resuscitation-promoting factor RpfA